MLWNAVLPDGEYCRVGVAGADPPSEVGLTYRLTWSAAPLDPNVSSITNSTAWPVTTGTLVLTVLPLYCRLHQEFPLASLELEPKYPTWMLAGFVDQAVPPPCAVRPTLGVAPLASWRSRKLNQMLCPGAPIRPFGT